MIKKIKHLPIIILLLLCGGFVKAQVTTGGELTYKHISGNTYKMRIAVYYNCNNFHSDPIALMNFTGPSTFSDTMPLVDTIFYHNTCGTSCSASTPAPIGVVYEHQVTFPSHGPWSMNSYFCCMPNPGSVVNLNLPSASNIYYVEGSLDNSIGGNSLSFNHPAEFNFYAGSYQAMNFSADDPEADSLTFEKYSPSFYVYNSGYSPSNPLGPTGLASLNTDNGNMQSYTGSVGSYWMSVRVNSFKNGVKTGSIMRNELCTFSPSSLLTYPTFMSGQFGYNFQDDRNLCVGDTLFLLVYPSDSIANQPLTVTSDGILSGSSLTLVSTSPLVYQLAWIATLPSGLSHKTYFPTITISDTTCPYHSVQTFAYSLHVSNCTPLSAGPDQTICFPHTMHMAATGVGTWSALASNPAIITFVNPSSPTSFVNGFTAAGTYGAVWSNGILSDTMYFFKNLGVHAGQDTTVCPGTCLTIGGSPTTVGLPPFTYRWYSHIPGGLFDTVANPIVCSTVTNLYTVEVIDSNGCWDTAHVSVTVTNCLSDSVWPGDADSNHLVDNNDLLPIGIGYGATGPVRAWTGIAWVAHAANNWASSFTSGENYKHADCNGDGTIDASDTVAIVTNFGLTHSKTSGSPSPWRSGIPGLTLQLSNDTVLNGDTLSIDLLLGDAATPVANIYGLAFTLNYDPIIFDTPTTSFRFENSWLGNNTNSINISKDFSAPGTLKAAITGIDHLNRSGYGRIATYIGNITTGNINGKNLRYYVNRCYITNVKAVDIHGAIIPINEGIDSNSIGYEPSGIKAVDAAVHLSIQPNPASDQVKVIAESNITDISVTDVLGKVVMSEKTAGKNTEILNTSHLVPGVYIIHVAAINGSATAKLMITR